MPIHDRFQKHIENQNRQLEAAFGEIERLFNFVLESDKLRPRLGNMVDWGAVSKEEKNLLNQYMGFNDVNKQIASLSLLVLCYGNLERFLRAALEKAVLAIDESYPKFLDLPPLIRTENIFRTGQAFMLVKDETSTRDYDFSKLSKNIGQCLPESESYALNAICFTIGHGIVTEENINAMFRRIDLKIDWDFLGRDKELRKLLKEDKTRDCTKSAKEILKNLIARRNIIAHSGGSELVIEDEHLSLLLRFIPYFCRGFSEHVGVLLRNRYN